MDNFEYELKSKTARIKVIGVGGAGKNMINLLMDEHLPNADLYVANTDYQDLENSQCPNKIYLSGDTNGLGAGGDPEKGRKCAEANSDKIKEVLKDTDLLIIAAGFGGGTGTGASPVIARIAKEMNILTVAIITTPFAIMESPRSLNIAKEGINQISEIVDSYVVVSNEKLLEKYGEFTVGEAFRFSNITLKNSIKLFHDILNVNGFLNIDFNDLKRILDKAQNTIITTGKFSGNNRAQKALEIALDMPLATANYESCSKLLILYQIDHALALKELSNITEQINKKFNVDSNVNSVIGIQYVENYDKKDGFFQVNIIATNVDDATHGMEIKSSTHYKNNSTNFSAELENVDDFDDQETPGFVQDF